jgi:lipid A 3-O-deacylase
MFWTNNSVTRYLLLVVIIVLTVYTGKGLRGDPYQDRDPAFISVGIGKYDFNRKKDSGGEVRVEYRSEKQLAIFKPFVAIASTNTSQGFVGAGVLSDFFVGRRFVITPSLAPHYYWGGNKKLDLGHWVEFRSQIEFAYRFDNRSRLGMAISHYSNAGLGNTNPGTETGTIYLSVPIN